MSPARLNMILRRRFGPPGSEPLCRMDAVDECPRELEERGCQTDEIQIPAAPPAPCAPCSPESQQESTMFTSTKPSTEESTEDQNVVMRSLSDCLQIAKSEVCVIDYKY